MLDDVGFAEAIARRVCDFLTTITTAEGGVPFTIPSVNAYPHQNWWTAPDEPPASVNPTASIAGLLHKHGVDHPWLGSATDYCWRTIESGHASEVHELLAVVLFLEHAPDRERAARAFDQLRERILAETALEANAPGYVKKPLDWAPAPSSRCRQLFSDDVIAAHLAALASSQRPDGGWPITWPPLSPAHEAEWRGMVTLNALKTLRAYGRLECARRLPAVRTCSVVGSPSAAGARSLRDERRAGRRRAYSGCAREPRGARDLPTIPGPKP